MKSTLFSLVAVIALCFAAAPPSQAQEKYFKGKTDGAILKSANGGEADECTTGTAVSTAAAATINADSGKVTTESLTTAAAATYTFVLTNSKITAANKVFVSVETASAGTPVVSGVAPGAGTCTIKITNVHASAAFNNTLKISFWRVQ